MDKAAEIAAIKDMTHKSLPGLEKWAGSGAGCYINEVRSFSVYALSLPEEIEVLCRCVWRSLICLLHIGSSIRSLLPESFLGEQLSPSSPDQEYSRS